MLWFTLAFVAAVGAVGGTRTIAVLAGALIVATIATVEHTFNLFVMGKKVRDAETILDNGDGMCRVCDKSLSVENYTCAGCRGAHRKHMRDEIENM